MSVFVKGMKMPRNCIECPLQFGGICCVQPPEIDDPFVAETVDEAAKGRTNWCPLVSVPPHGRCIDADAVMLHIQDYIEEYDDDLDDNGYHSGKWCAMKEAEMVINDAPTIIEAEGRE